MSVPPLRGPRDEDADRLNARRAEHQAQQQSHRQFGNVRVVVFLAAIAMAGAAFGRGDLSAWWLVVPLVILVAVGTRMARLETAIDIGSRAVKFYAGGVARLDGQWVGRGETGVRFRDEHHLYAADLDILGSASLFELLCRARTERGEATLASWLLNRASPEVIDARQGAVCEIAPRLDFREDMALAGDVAQSAVHADTLISWGEQPVHGHALSLRVMAWVLSGLGALAAIGGVTYGLVRFGFIVLTESTMDALGAYSLTVGSICLVVHSTLKRRTDRVIEGVFSAGHDLGLLAGLLCRIEAEAFSSPYLQTLREALVTENRPASSRIASLRRFVDLLNFRRNEIMKLLGPLLLWDFHLSCAIEQWRRVSGPMIRRWLGAVGEIEATASLACYCYERPRNVFPEVFPQLGAESPLFEAEALGHPLLPEDRVVANDVALGGELRVLVVSGSNMSGKSTLLRTIGINAVLAQAGAPVAPGACDCRRSPSAHLFESRTRCRRARRASTRRSPGCGNIMDVAGGRRPCCFPDRRDLHGTNSHDRLIGAEAVVRGLVDRGAIGLITTHDLALTEIVDALRHAPPTCISRTISKTVACDSTTACARAWCSTAMPWNSCDPSDWMSEPLPGAATTSTRNSPDFEHGCSDEQRDVGHHGCLPLVRSPSRSRSARRNELPFTTT